MSRPLSGVERLWLVADAQAPPFVNQLVLEGAGAPDVDALRAAVNTLGAWAVCSSRLRGRLRGAAWVGGGEPWRLRRVDGSAWSGRSEVGAGFLSDALPPTTGPLCELLIVDGGPPRLVLRTHHAAFDGRGTLELAAALFACARGEPVRELPLSGPTDAELAATLGVPAEATVARNCGTPLPIGPGRCWRRVTASVSPRGMLPRLAHAIGEAVPPDQRCRVDLAVDLRRHAPELRSTANLTGLVRLGVDGHRDRADPVGRIRAELERRLRRKEEAAFPRAADALRGLPLRLMASAARTHHQRRVEDGLFGSSANLSNVGRLDLPALSGAGFAAEAGWFVPPGSPSLPLFLALTGGPRGVELCATAPADGADLEALLARLVQSLEAA